nr:hypothetical protein CFP56_03886 [Quercus suber]
MAEETGRSRFLSKSKWGKVFRENDSPAAQGAPSTFELNNDVADFLKPSIDAAKEKQASIRAHLAPKLDIALAKRGPDAQTVRLAEEASSMRAEDVPMYYTKPRRKQGLMVGFVKAVPEVIGEGGDEAPDPPSEISRQKVRMARSTSDRRPSAPSDGSQWPRIDGRPALPPPRQEDVPIEGGTADFVAPSLRRAHTSHNEFSPELGRKFKAPPLRPPSPPKPSLSRTPTGFSSQHELDSPDSLESSPPVPMIHSSVGTQSRPLDQPDMPHGPALPRTRLDVAAGVASLRRPSKEPVSPVVLKQRNMSAGEGAILRRASALFMENDEKNGVPRDPNSGIQPSADYYDKLMEMTAGFSPPDAAPLHAIRNVDPGDAPHFEDIRYTKRNSDDMSSKSMPEHRREAHTRAPQEVQPFQPLPPSHVPPVFLQDSRSLQPQSYQAHSTPSQRQLEPQGSEARIARVSPVSHRHDQYSSRVNKSQSDDTLPAPDRRPPPPAGIRRPDDSGLPYRPVLTQAQNISAPSQIYDEGHAELSGTGERTYRSRRQETNTHSLQTSTETNYVPFRNTSQQAPTGLRKAHGQPSNGTSARSDPGPSSQPQSFVHKSPSSADTIGAASSGQHAQFPPTNHRHEQSLRASPAGSDRSTYRPAASPRSPATPDGDAKLAWVDFTGRVAHMKGVFRLTAERERPGEQCDSQAWLRAALWWYSIGKAGLEVLFHQRVKGARELLTQPHVDLAKAWWIMSEMLQPFNTDGDVSLQIGEANSSLESTIKNGVLLLNTHLQSLALSMTKSSLLPPHQSLIQGQDTKIWLRYPRFTMNDMAALNGDTRVPSSSSVPPTPLAPTSALPPGDSRLDFCYGRFAVDAFLSSDDADTDRVVLPCIFSMIRSKRDFQVGIVIASQNELVNLSVLPRQSGSNGLTWRDVSWSANAHSLHIRLPRGLDLTVRMEESSFRAVWNLVEHSRKVEHTLRNESDERLVHEVRLEELQYAGSTNSHAFPQDKMRGCMARLFERSVEHNSGAGVRRMYRGFRLLLATEPGHKSLNSISEGLGGNAPLYFEFLTDAAANGTTAMIIRVQEPSRQCRILLVFRDMTSRQAFHDILNGLTVGPHETIVTRAALTSLNIQPASQAAEFAASAHPALQALQWQKLGVTNSMTDDPHAVVPDTVASESLRIVARHAAGCITDRLNLSTGDMLFRLPCTNVPAIQILRSPQEDLTMSIDSRSMQPATVDGMAELYRMACQQLTIRTFTFAGTADLHAFQTAITGWSILYEGVASTFGISRRRMVVPIYHKWTASDVRLQVVAHDALVKVVAFMEGFGHADAMVVQVKSMDVFETIKGDGKGKKWALKMVDAKFSLPMKEEKKEKEGSPAEMDAQAVRRRFVNLEGLEYAGEHDDITIGFETEDARDQFAKALPAATTVGRLMTLKRRV